MTRARAVAVRSISSVAEENRENIIAGDNDMPAKDYRDVRLCRFFYIKGKFSFRRTPELKMPAGSGHAETDGG